MNSKRCSFVSTRCQRIIFFIVRPNYLPTNRQSECIFEIFCRFRTCNYSIIFFTNASRLYLHTRIGIIRRLQERLKFNGISLDTYRIDRIWLSLLAEDWSNFHEIFHLSRPEVDILCKLNSKRKRFWHIISRINNGIGIWVVWFYIVMSLLVSCSVFQYSSNTLHDWYTLGTSTSPARVVIYKVPGTPW